MVFYVVGVAALHEVYHVVGTEILLQCLHRPEHYHRLFRGIYLHLGMQTVVAVAAVVLGIILTEIVEQHLASAY